MSVAGRCVVPRTVLGIPYSVSVIKLASWQVGKKYNSWQVGKLYNSHHLSEDLSKDLSEDLSEDSEWPRFSVSPPHPNLHPLLLQLSRELPDKFSGRLCNPPPPPPPSMRCGGRATVGAEQGRQEALDAREDEGPAGVAGVT